MQTRFLILGCGPTGLGAAYKMRDMGIEDYLIVDQESQPGGLAASYHDEKGFSWGVGGQHLQFSRYEYFDRAMHAALPVNEWLDRQCESWIRSNECFVPHPFHNNLRYLPREVTMECLRGLLKQWRDQSTERPANLEEWILRTFGDGIANQFLLPYNRKKWAYPSDEMAYQWVGEHGLEVDIERALANIVYDRTDESWGESSEKKSFKVPAFGGTGRVWNSIAKIVRAEKIRLETKVVEIDPVKKVVSCANGDTIEYEQLLSTIPVDILTRITKGVSPRVVSAAQRLKRSSTHIVGVGIEGERPLTIGTKSWVYFPEADCPFYRATVYSNLSPHYVPDASRYYSLITETSESALKPVDQDELVTQTIEGLRRNGLIGPDDTIASTWHHRARYGFPTPSIARDSILNHVITALEAMSVFSRGRFGGWKHEVGDQDQCFMQGVEWSDWVINEIAETTYTVTRAPVSRARPVKVRRIASTQRSTVSSSSVVKSARPTPSQI